MQEPATAYTAMDVVALPSYHEGLGYSLVEAAAMEIPVIGTRIPGEVDALVEGVNGLLVEPGNPEQLAAAIRTYLQNPAIAQAHGKSGREFVKAQFQRPAVWDRIRGEYQRLLATRLHGRRFA
jgi:glycosyltransferase involved in cell wall biosynthesis